MQQTTSTVQIGRVVHTVNFSVQALVELDGIGGITKLLYDVLKKTKSFELKMFSVRVSIRNRCFPTNWPYMITTRQLYDTGNSNLGNFSVSVCIQL